MEEKLFQPDEDFMKNYDEDSYIGYILEVDVNHTSHVLIYD